MSEVLDHRQAKKDFAALLQEAGLTLAIQPIENRPDNHESRDAAHYSFTVSTERGLRHSGFYSKGWGNFAEHAKRLPYHITTDPTFVAQILRGYARPTLAAEAAAKEVKPYLAKKFPPALVEIVSGLLLDAQNSDQNFIYWAAELGYSEDSIKAKAAWEACNDTRRFLERALSRETLDRAYDLANEI
jgi:hypothetical protein